MCVCVRVCACVCVCVCVCVRACVHACVCDSVLFAYWCLPLTLLSFLVWRKFVRVCQLVLSPFKNKEYITHYFERILSEVTSVQGEVL